MKEDTYFWSRIISLAHEESTIRVLKTNLKIFEFIYQIYRKKTFTGSRFPLFFKIQLNLFDTISLFQTCLFPALIVIVIASTKSLEVLVHPSFD